MSVLKDLFTKGADKLATSLGKAFDDNFSNREEMARAGIDLEKVKADIIKEANRHIEIIGSQADEIEKAYLQDVQQSRASNVSIQESDKASWMAKNVGYIIDLTLIFSFLLMLVIIVYRAVPEENKELFYMSFGSLGTFAATSIYWHRGSSQSSSNKQNFIDRMMRK